jgi:hypothetical protein
MAWEQTQPELDRAQFDLMEATLEHILEEEDHGTQVAIMCCEGLGIDPPEEGPEICPNCRGGGEPGPYSCRTCRNTGEIPTQAQMDAKEQYEEERGDHLYEMRREALDEGGI